VKVVANATYWLLQVWHIAKVVSGMGASGLRQLYLTVSVPGITYAAEVWYTGIHQPAGGTRKKGSVAITNKLKTTQCRVAKTIMGVLSTTVGDTMDVYAFILPVNLLFTEFYSELLHDFALSPHLICYTQSSTGHFIIRSNIIDLLEDKDDALTAAEDLDSHYPFRVQEHHSQRPGLAF
jgi:hypothetical protein